MEYKCEACEFSSKLKTNLARHLETKRHKEQMEQQTPKVPVDPVVLKIEELKLHNKYLEQMVIELKGKVDELSILIKENCIKKKK